MERSSSRAISPIEGGLMRRKDLTRAHSKVDKESIAAFLDTLHVSGSVREELKQVTPENYTGICRFLDEKTNRGERLIKGQAASIGVAEGRATVIKTPEGIDFTDGDAILICPFLSRQLIPLFPKFSGLVSDIGGILSDPATVAREYGIPTVVGTFKATELINDGDFVRVDGTKGEVAIISKA
jgi:rifampicin phosphotransferase